MVLQYADDLLLAAQTQESCMEGTHLLLTLLRDAGYKVSREKAQICQEKNKYLGFHISQGQRQLDPEKSLAVCSVLVPLHPTPGSKISQGHRLLQDLDIKLLHSNKTPL